MSENHKKALAERDAWQNNLDPVEITQAKFDTLLEYSSTIPTGKTIGKQWKRYLWIGPKAGHWVLCEYIPDPEPGFIGIDSKIILIKSETKEA